MRFSTWCGSAIVSMCLVTGVAAEPFRLLELDGSLVKWGEPHLGSGATVTYALADHEYSFPKARNCRRLMPITAVAERSGIAMETVERELAAALAAWERVADIHFVPAADPSQANILIGAQVTPRGQAFANVSRRPDEPAVRHDRVFTAGLGGGGWTAPQPRIAQISRSMVCLNPDRLWKTGYDGDLDVYDLRYTLTHEIGHAIGLDHPSGSGELMSFRYLETFHEPQPGDIEGAIRLYGPVADEQQQ